MALFGTATPLSKIIGESYSVFSASFARMAIASAVLTPFVIVATNRFSSATRKDLVVMAAIAGAGMVGFTATMLFGMTLTTGVIGSTIMSAAPAVTALAAVVFLGASVNARKISALVLAVCGVTAINVFRGEASGGNAVLLGAGLVIIAVCFEAAYTLLSRQLSSGLSSPAATLGASLMAAPLFIVLAVLFDPAPFDFSTSSIRAVSALLFWGAATGGLAPVLWYRGVRSAPPALAAGCMAIMPVTSLLLSYSLLDESFEWAHALGFGLVFAGLMLMIWEHAK